MSDRFFIAGPLGLGDCLLQGAEAHHLAQVRRFEKGDVVTLFNGDGREYCAEIHEIEKKSILLSVVRIAEPRRELGFPLHMGVAFPKGDRGDFLIEKLTELGVTDLTPLQAERSVVQAREGKVEKWQRAVIEASKQCGRNVLLRVHPPARFEQWCRLDSLPAARWVLHPDGAAMPGGPAAPEGLTAAVGPEGGFTAEELEAAAAAGFQRIGLGPRILRVETAAVLVAGWAALQSA